MSVVEVPELALVVLIGPSGAGKSTFAVRHFHADEVFSADEFVARTLALTGEPRTREAEARALEAMREQIGQRLATGKLAVVDAANVSMAARAPWVRLADRAHVPVVALVFDLPLRTCLDRNATRLAGRASEHLVRGQHVEMRRGLGGRPSQALGDEGCAHVSVFATDPEVNAAQVRRTRLPADRRDVEGPFDVVGDVHGCARELGELLGVLGWEPAGASYRHPAGRRLVFLGDLVDRGPANLAALELVMRLCADGVALCVPGNHDVKVLRWLLKKPVRPSHGMQKTIDELQALPAPAFESLRERAIAFLAGLSSHLVLDGGRLVVAHAGLVEPMHGRCSNEVTSFALYGDTNGEVDSYGLPVRLDWSQRYQGRATVVYGHTPMLEARWLNNTLCIDTGCVFGGKLTALRWPERELVAVPAHAVHYPALRPLAGGDGSSLPPATSG